MVETRGWLLAGGPSGYLTGSMRLMVNLNWKALLVSHLLLFSFNFQWEFEQVLCSSNVVDPSRVKKWSLLQSFKNIQMSLNPCLTGVVVVSTPSDFLPVAPKPKIKWPISHLGNLTDILHGLSLMGKMRTPPYPRLQDNVYRGQLSRGGGGWVESFSPLWITLSLLRFARKCLFTNWNNVSNDLNAIFEFFRQFASRCLHYIQKGEDNFALGRVVCVKDYRGQ